MQSIKAVSPKNAQLAHQRRMPALMVRLNKLVREGRRWFSADQDFPLPFYDMVFKAMVDAGWEVKQVLRGSYIGLEFRAKNEFWVSR